MRRRGTTAVYNTASRCWLLAAGVSLVLPVSTRLGYWLPIHLALAGAVSVAISGNMMTFAATLTATPGPGSFLTGLQFALVNAGALLIAVGFPTSRPTIVAVGGASFVGAAALLLVALRSAWRRSLNRRHRAPMVLYALAVSSVMVGGAIGAVLGAGAVSEGLRFEDIRLAHLSLNVLGWASLTIVATLTTLLPTVLRIRMPPWNAAVSGACLVGGLVLLATGLVTRLTPVAALGAVLYWSGALQVASLAVRGLRAPRKWPAPAAAKHMVVAVAWFVFGTSALAWAGLRGSIQTVVPVFEVSLVCGWVLQILLGSWLYLLPMARPGRPDDRRRWLTAVDVGATTEVAVLNAGLVLVALAAGDRVPAGLGLAGASAALAVAGFILAKSWAYPALAGMPSIARRSQRIWGA